ncbi:MAG: OmpA family protein [Hyphomicrobium sp.]|nr:OmpA family protein [Hyphomicrobium sp.]
MSHSVDRLKELLFESESHALQDLARRIDSVAEGETRTREDLGRRIDSVEATDRLLRDDLARRFEALAANETLSRQDFTRRVETVAESEARARDELVRRIDGLASMEAQARDELKSKIEEVYARAGNSERMTASVSEIISEALRRAEVAKHSELSQSIAPLVVTTIKTELRNSQDEMVEALYPITGRLVKSYVASAIKDLTDQMNRRLEQNPLMLRLQSLSTGRSVGELALAGTQDFDVKELYLIRRGSGELVAHWPDKPISGREHAMSGVLAAVNEFANDAFSADQASLRQIDLGGEEVYLRGSPIYLLAARCSGQAPKSIEQTLDDAFLNAVEDQHRIDAAPFSAADARNAKSAALASLGTTLKSDVARQLEDLHRPAGKGALKTLAALILLPLFAWLAWGWFSDYRVASVRSTAERIVAADPAMLGYPAQIDVTNSGRSLTISGLTPSLQAKTRIVSDLTRSLPGIALNDRLSVVAGSDITIPDVSPELARVRQDVARSVGELSRATLARTGTRAEWRLTQAAADISHAAAAAQGKPEAGVLKRNLAEAEAILAEMKHLRSSNDGVTDASQGSKSAAAYQTLARRLETLNDDLVQSLGGEARTSSANKAGAVPAGTALALDAAIEQFAADSERVAAVASTLAIAKSLAPVTVVAPPAPAPAPTPPAQPTPRERLEAFARSHAVFFAANTDYRNADAATRTLAELAPLIKASNALVRVVGYTDEVGAQNRNAQLAQDRAGKVQQALIALGVPANQLVTVGRANAIDLSDTRGALSPNRRVEFEIGFEGEAQP